MTGRPPDDEAEDEADTGLPVLTTWPALYAFVAVTLAAYVVGLALLPGWAR